MGICSFEGCTKEAKSKGLCAAHYQRQRNAGKKTKIKHFIVKKCNAAGCDEDALRLGFCPKHLKEFNFE
jgi:hypothetical protein